MKRILYWKWAQKRVECSPKTVPSVCGGACCYSCRFLGPNGCTLSNEDKPLACHIFPFVLNSGGNIVRSFHCQNLCKGNFNSGDQYLIETLKDTFVFLFGEKQTNEAIEAVKRCENYTFDTSELFEKMLLKQYNEGEWYGFKIVDSMLGISDDS